MACFTGPNSPAPAGGPSTLSRIQCGGLTYWPYSYVDDRVFMGIVAYDSSGNLVQQTEKPDARYVWKITDGHGRTTVTFWGLANQTIVMTWAELRGSPTIRLLARPSPPFQPG